MAPSSDAPRRDRIGFIGLGNMGRGMASNLRRKQFLLAVHDVASAGPHEADGALAPR